MQPESTVIEKLSSAEQEAFSLTEAALYLDKARTSGRDGVLLVDALNNNLDLWVMIRALAESRESVLPDAIRSNLVRLSNFVAQTTFSQGTAITDANLDTLININLQLSEGLLAGHGTAPVPN